MESRRGEVWTKMPSVCRLGQEAVHEALSGEADMAKLHQSEPSTRQFPDFLLWQTVIAPSKEQKDASGNLSGMRKIIMVTNWVERDPGLGRCTAQWLLLSPRLWIKAAPIRAQS